MPMPAQPEGKEEKVERKIETNRVSGERLPLRFPTLAFRSGSPIHSNTASSSSSSSSMPQYRLDNHTAPSIT